ncbi:Oidioi.mRNA.OKI2018_I69.chr1.g2058.t1.cds [Oikopleura dioica]|uniref:Oidioi.mRNA.OKI2018_I69.chr1.g2058.t1.cds n=1 Tax=Oikopleura dioica TaxID=34765 RepID=A0ABN7SW60_OIKDI|nr:Oidioi.mRNA.OKI2018_I69.chr1.g2058.t1.cds [Oikopleura dioica]
MSSQNWGLSVASFSGYDEALDIFLEKTSRLAKFLTEKAQLQIEYSEKMKALTIKHQTKFMAIGNRNGQKGAAVESSTNKVFINVLGHTQKWCHDNDKMARIMLQAVNQDLSPTEKKSRERRSKLLQEDQKIRSTTDELKKRVVNAKSKSATRQKESEQARLKYLKCKERPDKNNLKEEDNLRVIASDKEALAERARDELSRVTKEFQKFQIQATKDTLPVLCSSQQDIYQNMTQCWKVSLKEIARKLRDTNDTSKQSITSLNKEIDSIDRHWDSDLVFSQKQRPAPVIPTTSGFQEEVTTPKLSQRTIEMQNAEIMASLQNTKIEASSGERRESSSHFLIPASSDRSRKQSESREKRKKDRRTTRVKAVDVDPALRSIIDSKAKRPGRRTEDFSSKESSPSASTVPITLPLSAELMGTRGRPEGLSAAEDERTEWDEMSIAETLGRATVLYDFTGERSHDTISVRAGEIIDVSMRDVDGWSKIKKVESGEEGYIPTTYFKLVDGYC